MNPPHPREDRLAVQMIVLVLEDGGCHLLEGSGCHASCLCLIGYQNLRVAATECSVYSWVGETPLEALAGLSFTSRDDWVDHTEDGVIGETDDYGLFGLSNLWGCQSEAVVFPEYLLHALEEVHDGCAPLLVRKELLYTDRAASLFQDWVWPGY